MHTCPKASTQFEAGALDTVSWPAGRYIEVPAFQAMLGKSCVLCLSISQQFIGLHYTLHMLTVTVTTVYGTSASRYVQAAYAPVCRSVCLCLWRGVGYSKKIIFVCCKDTYDL